MITFLNIIHGVHEDVGLFPSLENPLIIYENGKSGRWDTLKSVFLKKKIIVPREKTWSPIELISKL